MSGEMSVLLSEVYLHQGRSQEALRTLLGDEAAPYMDNFINDLALTYYRLGNHNLALQYLNANAGSQYISPDYAKDLPGTGTGRGLEARILVARAANRFFREETLPDLQEALQLSPANGAVAHLIAVVLMGQKHFKEAVPYLELAAKNGKGKYAKKAEISLESVNRFYFIESEQH